MWFSKLSRLVLSTLNLIALGSVLAVGLIVVIQSEAAEETTPDAYPGHLVLLPGERLVLGTVEEIAGGMIRVNIGELEPRFLSLKRAVEQGEWPIKKGDRVEIAVSAENLVVDYHPINQCPWVASFDQGTSRAAAYRGLWLGGDSYGRRKRGSLRRAALGPAEDGGHADRRAGSVSDRGNQSDS